MPEHSKKSSRIDEQTTRSTQKKTLCIQGLRDVTARYEILIRWNGQDMNLLSNYMLMSDFVDKDLGFAPKCPQMSRDGCGH